MLLPIGPELEFPAGFLETFEYQHMVDLLQEITDQALVEEIEIRPESLRRLNQAFPELACPRVFISHKSVEAHRLEMKHWRPQRPNNFALKSPPARKDDQNSNKQFLPRMAGELLSVVSGQRDIDTNRPPMREQDEIRQSVLSGREARGWILDFVRAIVRSPGRSPRSHRGWTTRRTTAFPRS